VFAILINLEKISDCNQLTDKDNPMKRHKKSSHWYRSAVSPFRFLLSVGIASAQPTRSDTSELTAQALSTQERKNGAL